jgi:lipopolysaccharide/colanic/teichoic acid biosynthesis glycosyltransferase
MKKRTRISIVSIDLIFIIGAFCLSVFIKPTANPENYFIRYSIAFLAFVLLWITVSLLSKKFDINRFDTLMQLYWNIIKTNIVVLALASLFMYAFRDLEYSRFIVFGTIGIATFFELIFSYFHFYIKHAKIADNNNDSRSRYHDIIRPFQGNGTDEATLDQAVIKEGKKIDETLKEETGEAAYRFIDGQIDIDKGDYIIFSTTTRFNIKRLPENTYSNIINLRRINDIRFVNKFFEEVNEKIPKGGIFINCVETKNQRKARILKKFPPVLNYIYYTFDFIVKRIFPKFALTKKLYFLVTRGENRVISKAETIGRLYSCGFRLKSGININGHYYFAAEKRKAPAYDENPTYGPFIKLPRVGKHGKIIYVYKLRTMHPFAEYIQDFVYEKYNLKEGGKFKNDFRITTLGRLFRKFWIDELPMLINLAKGEMKIFGVRPLSRHYFSLYYDEMQERRTKYKPGLVPPYYVDLPETLDEIQHSEKKYLDAYDNHPLLTDITYLSKAFWNIVVRKKRSS